MITYDKPGTELSRFFLCVSFRLHSNSGSYFYLHFINKGKGSERGKKFFPKVVESGFTASPYGTSVYREKESHK